MVAGFVVMAFTTFIGLNRFEHNTDYALGALIVACLALAVWSFRRTDDLPVLGSAALAGAVFFYLVAFTAGLGFIPGMLTASPFAAMGLVLGWRRDVRLVAAMAVIALPLVWAVTTTGVAPGIETVTASPGVKPTPRKLMV